MKKLMTLIVTCSLIIGQAIAGQADLQIKSNANSPMTVFLDGQQIANNNTNVSVSGLTDGNHYVEIFKIIGNGWFQESYLAYSGYVFLPNNTFSKFKIKQNNQFVLQEQIALYTPPPTCGTPPPYYNPYPAQNPTCGGNSSTYTYTYNGCTQQAGCTCGSCTPVNVCTQQPGCSCGNCSYTSGGYYDNYTYSGCTQQPNCGCGNCAPPVNVCTQQTGCGCGSCGNMYDNYNPYGYGYNSAMSDGDFQVLLATIQNQWFASDMMAVYNQAVVSNHFTAQQAKQLVNTFTYDSDKVNVAKSTYTKTIDKENYYIVYDALDYSSSVQELSAYIASL
ncbi:MAG: DUF4476 domain-containing protein [Chitinophagales bacterium]